MQDNVSAMEKELARVKGRLASSQGGDLSAQAVEVNGHGGPIRVLAATIEGADAKVLRETLDQLKGRFKSAAIVLGSTEGGKVTLIAGVTSDLTAKIKAGDLVNHVATQVGGKGGGRPDMAQAGGTDAAALPAALASRARLGRAKAVARMQPLRVVAPEGIRVRSAGRDDCEALLALYCEVHDAHLDADPDEFEPLTPDDEARMLREFARADPSQLFVAESARGLVGCVRFELRSARKPGRRAQPRVYIDLLVVAPKWQSKGVGAMLLEQVHAVARSYGIDTVELDVYQFNAAGLRLYEKMGYATTLRRMKLRLDRV